MRPHGEFAWGVGLTLLLAQGWSPTLCTFWNIARLDALTTDVFFYALFPWLVTLRRPRTRNRIVWTMLRSGASVSSCRALRHLQSRRRPAPRPLLQRVVAPRCQIRPAATSAVLPLRHGAGLPQRLHPGAQPSPHRARRRRLCRPLHHPDASAPTCLISSCTMACSCRSALIVLGLAGRNFLTRLFSVYPLIVIGEASYCLYILHFNLWNLLHDDTHLLARAGLLRYDPWLLLCAGSAHCDRSHVPGRAPGSAPDQALDASATAFP